MRVVRILLAGVAVAGMLACEVRAAEPTKEDIANAERRGDAVADVALAANLAAFGRDAKSPESLVIAGGMLIRAHKSFAGKSEPLDAKATDEKGNPVKGEAARAVALDKQAEALFDEARVLVGEDKARKVALEGLIKNANSFVWGPDTTARPSIGWPRTMTRQLSPGETQTYTIGFVGGQPAAVAMTSTGPARIQFDLSQIGGASLFSLKGLNAAYNWVPGRDKDNVRRVKVTLTNVGRQPTTYTLTTN